MQKKLLIMLVCATGILSGCKEEGITPTGEACMGTDNDSLVEGLEGKCQKGDIIATKHPAYFCDFKSEIALNNYNLNAGKPPCAPESMKAGVPELLWHHRPQTRTQPVSL